MSKLTKKQIDRAREQLGDGWVLDPRMAMIWGKKVPVYRIEDEDGSGYVDVTVDWHEVEETRATDYGALLHIPSGTYRPAIEVRHYVRDGNGNASHFFGCGMGGMSFPVEAEPVSRRTFSRLARVTRELATEDLRWFVAKETERRAGRDLAFAQRLG